MSYSFRTEDNILIVTIENERATVEFSSELKKELLEKIEQKHNNVIFDLSRSNFVDSSFLGTLVAGLKKCTMNNGDLKIVGLQEPVMSMFELTRLCKIFDILDSVDEAIKAF
ncbi:MAG: STAS domain-containing protein [Calditrichaceae bacterium]|nr:STAS domain-containing protein [Calditrichaceae bacterium]